MTKARGGKKNLGGFFFPAAEKTISTAYFFFRPARKIFRLAYFFFRPAKKFFRPAYFFFPLAWIFFFAAMLCAPSHAQLAGLTLNVTGISVKRLGNAVVIRIETDGTVRFGGDFRDWIDVDNGFRPRPTQSVRLRIVQARAKLPAYVPIDAYPVDGAAISLGRTPFDRPFFSDGGYGQPQPVVDVELRFATPVLIRKFTVQPYRSVNFGEYLGPKEASIELSNDRRAIVITVVPDRADLLATKHLDRSPVEGRKTNLAVVALDASSFRVEALHAPLRGLLNVVGEATGTQFVARPEVADVPVTLFLPRATPAQFLDALSKATNLAARIENGATVLGRGDEFFDSRSLSVRNVTPDAARLLFPDFLLPFLRADHEHNTLVAVQTPAMLDKIEAQLAVIDTARAQFEVTAQFYELSRTREQTLGATLGLTSGENTGTLDASTGDFVVKLGPGQTAQVQANLQLLASQGRARLIAAPRLVALSGATGTLFSGQTRYIKVLQNTYFGTQVKALALQIGAGLNVTARGSNAPDDPIRLDLAPRLSTIDAIENGSGLPTVGIRELSGTLSVGTGESVAFAGLESNIESSTRGRALGIIPTRRKSGEVRALLVLVTAKRV